MEYFAALSVATAAIVILTGALYWRARDPGLVIGMAALYYWSLYGAWAIVIDKTGGFSGKNYHYLEQKLFPIALDRDYLVTLGLYAGFIVVVQLTMLAMVERPRPRAFSRVALRHDPILILGFLAAAGSIFLMWDKLGNAFALNVSGYQYTRTETDQWFTLHQVLNRLALIAPAIGVATLAAGPTSKCFVSVRKSYTRAAYLLLFGVMATFTFVLGNKNEILAALVAGLLAYLGSAARPRVVRVALLAGMGLWFLYAIDYFRGVPMSKLAESVGEHWKDAAAIDNLVPSSNEAYGAHFSMYGVLRAATEPRFGYSFYSLACSIIPRVLWPSRPADIYLYYSESVGAIQNQGYSIHHATGWYLNFGYAGVALGAVVLGLVWAWCLNARGRVRRGSGRWFRIFAIIAPWVFVANLPSLIRSGPEGYKGLAVDGVAMPMVALSLACRLRRPEKKMRRGSGPAWRTGLKCYGG
ncbi:MAG TPA: hypothetical protein VKR43_11715 [Bryobacteraceae bacterium]|nr:hypothetical protein [Bryobacteraceae bacterium]